MVPLPRHVAPKSRTDARPSARFVAASRGCCGAWGGTIDESRSQTVLLGEFERSFDRSHGPASPETSARPGAVRIHACAASRAPSRGDPNKVCARSAWNGTEPRPPRRPVPVRRIAGAFAFRPLPVALVSRRHGRPAGCHRAMPLCDAASARRHGARRQGESCSPVSPFRAARGAGTDAGGVRSTVGPGGAAQERPTRCSGAPTPSEAPNGRESRACGRGPRRAVSMDSASRSTGGPCRCRRAPTAKVPDGSGRGARVVRMSLSLRVGAFTERFPESLSTWASMGPIGRSTGRASTRGAPRTSAERTSSAWADPPRDSAAPRVHRDASFEMNQKDSVKGGPPARGFSANGRVEAASFPKPRAARFSREDGCLSASARGGWAFPRAVRAETEVARARGTSGGFDGARGCRGVARGAEAKRAQPVRVCAFSATGGAFAQRGLLGSVPSDGGPERSPSGEEKARLDACRSVMRGAVVDSPEMRAAVGATTSSREPLFRPGCHQRRTS